MNPVYENLHSDMLEEITESQQVDLPEVERAAVGFWIAANHWEELKKRICPTVFQHEKDEIDFFRNVKPTFTGYIQYFTIISEALLFIPEKSENELTYWEEEMKRYDFFCDKHSEFVTYYKSGNHELDAAYFTKAPEDWQPVSPMMTYDGDKQFCSTHDWIVRGLLAHGMYNEYVKARQRRWSVGFEGVKN